MNRQTSAFPSSSWRHKKGAKIITTLSHDMGAMEDKTQRQPFCHYHGRLQHWRQWCALERTTFCNKEKRPCFKIVDVYHYILNRNPPQISEVRRFLHSVNTVTKTVKKLQTSCKLHISEDLIKITCSTHLHCKQILQQLWKYVSVIKQSH